MILRRVEAVADVLDRHIEHTHSDLMGRSEIEDADGQIVKQLTRIEKRQMELAAVVLGTPHRNFDGNTVRSGGMKEIVDAYSNGGFLKVDLPVWSKIAGLILTMMNILLVWLLIAGEIGAM